MPRFPVLQDGSSETLLAEIQQRVGSLLARFFEDGELGSVDGIVAFSFGSATVQIQVVPWHSKDVLVRVFSYLGPLGSPGPEDAAEKLLRLNATVPMGSFSLLFDRTVVFSCTLPGAHLDPEELLGALQTVGVWADQYDATIQEEEALHP